MRDANGQALAFVYCEDEPGRRTTGKLLTRAANIAGAAATEGRRVVQGPPRVSRGRCRALYSKWENCCKIVHGFGLDQLDLG